MAIRNPLTQELNNINERIRNRQDLWNIVNDQLFGLLNNQTNNRIIIDNNFLAQIGNLTTNINYTQQINNLTTQINTINLQIDNTNPPLGLRQQLEAQRARNATAEATALGVLPNQLYQAINSINNDIQRKISDINNQITALENQRTPLQNQLNEYQNIQTMYGAILTLRAGEITNITNLAGSINLNGQIPTQVLAYNWNFANAVNLNTAFLNNNQNINYEFCDTTSWENLIRQNNGIQLTLVGWQTATIRWLQINGNQLNWTNIQVDPIENLKFPLNIQIAIRWRIQESNTWINLDHYKTFNITINAPTLNAATRQQAYDNLNQNNVLDNRITSEYGEPGRTTIENNVIQEILRANGNENEVNQILNNEQLRNQLIQRIRGLPWLIPVINLQTLQTWFRTEMTRINRNVPVQFLVNQNAFTDYIRSGLPENATNYVRWEIRTAIDTSVNRDAIMRTLLTFQTDMANNKFDNNDHMRLDTNTPNNRPTWHPNNRFQRIFRRRSNRNNWTKFWEGKESDSISDKIQTNEWENSYDIKVWILWVNKVVTTINISWEDEPIILDTRDSDEMVHAILRLEATKTWEPINRKLRCNMALNALKALISKSPTSLHREFHWNVTAIDWQNYQVDRLDALIRWWNLIVRGSCANAHNNPPNQYRQRINHVVFDEQRYKSLHNIDELERWMISLSWQINGIMNSMADEFRTATSRIKLRPLMRYNTRFPLRLWRAKRAFWRMAHGRTNWDFDFETSAWEWNKNVNIKFERWKFTLSWEFQWEQYEFKWRSLGGLLRKKMHRLRVFDGVELAIVEKINEEMIAKLRTNSFIWPENFWVADLNQDKTWRIFIMDSKGDLSYLEIEDRALNPIPNWDYGRIPFNNLPPQRIRCNEKERREFMQNPLLAGRLLRTMRNRLRVF